MIDSKNEILYWGLEQEQNYRYSQVTSIPVCWDFIRIDMAVYASIHTALDHFSFEDL
jgi:hypothetical protein